MAPENGWHLGLGDRECAQVMLEVREGSGKMSAVMAGKGKGVQSAERLCAETRSRTA
jgi:hypothetical protein